MAEHGNDPFHHVRDSSVFELPQVFDSWLGKHIIELPAFDIFGHHFQLTKFMVLQVVAGLLTLLVFGPLAYRIRSGKPARGVWSNFWEMVAMYIRDNVVRPVIGDDRHHHGDGHNHEHGHHHVEVAPVETGGHPADRFLPFIWTCFFYILFCNLLGAIPWLGSPTGSINVTLALAVTAFAVTIITGSKVFGFVGFWKNMIPHVDAPLPMKIFLVPMIFVIEVVGVIIKHSVLAIRLYANIMGGHTVIGVMLGFIAAEGILGTWLWYLVMPASILGQIGIGLLELFFAFLQAYVFAFLATIFISMGSHAH